MASSESKSRAMARSRRCSAWDCGARREIASSVKGEKGWAVVAALAVALVTPALPGSVAAWTRSLLAHFDGERRAASNPAIVETAARATIGAANRRRRSPTEPVPDDLAGRGDGACVEDVDRNCISLASAPR